MVSIDLSVVQSNPDTLCMPWSTGVRGVMSDIDSSIFDAIA